MEKTYGAGATDTCTEKRQPLKKFRAGPVSATIWQNDATAKDGNATSFNTIAIDRRYKDRNGEWQSTASMRLNDLPKAALVATKAYEYLVLSGLEAE